MRHFALENNLSIRIMLDTKNMDNINRIKQLKKEKNAIILAHNYQRGDVQDIADFVGDSFGLSKTAASHNADVIVFCGVDFMAESAAILSPEKTVLMPELNAQCPMAAMITPESLKLEKQKYPDAAVVCYVNTSASVKAQSDICCTSSNAIRVVNSLDEDEIIFIPDRNLARYVADNTEKKIIPWNGYCPTHHLILPGDILLEKEEHPEAEILVHPECRPDVVSLADKVLSTSGMLKYVARSDSREFIIGTEIGLLHRLSKENPEKRFIPATAYAVCPNMKMNTLESIIRALENNKHIIRVPEDTRRKAKLALDRMLAVGRGD
ncbi:quinolinate synthetase [Candidatus Methanoperedens nitroreducens]|uniref:Quinolinate synthase n=2 Tax=Candidatus Methanoperedens nitratireducens TaxID=1392998 RepID=A0A062V270_9EURY|nr:quinolinate synthetase [Candidatus Methanoperedens nitroreducens]